MEPIPPHVKALWDQWNLRGFMLLSLWLQTFLIFISPFRKRTASKWVILTNWSAYLLADWAANFAVGLISNSDCKHGGAVNNDELLAFWAPFLLLHLGGPDTITAFALEDNELWLRHLFGLVFQLIAAVYVFIQTVPGNRLWVPAVLMILAGIIKYSERTRALYLASLSSFRESMMKAPDPGPNYAKLMEEYSSKKEAKLPTKIIMIAEPETKLASKPLPEQKSLGSNVRIVQEAFKLFKTFRGLIVDLIFSFRERNESREFFLKRTSNDAYEIIEVELNSFYEVLYTKAVVVHNFSGYCFRFLASVLVITSLSLFHYKTSKKGFHKIDIGITYTLLLGAIALDFIALVMLLFSDRSASGLKEFEDDQKPSRWNLSQRLHESYLNLKKPRWTVPEMKLCGYLKMKLCGYLEMKVCGHSEYKDYHVLATPTLFRRWSESVSGHNLVAYCIKKKTPSIFRNNGFTGCFVIDLPFLIVEQIYNFIGICLNSIISLFSLIRNWIIHQLRRIYFLNRFIDEFLYYGNAIVDKVIDFLGVKDLLDEMIYKFHVPLTKELWNFIFNELREKSLLSDDPETSKKICAARGEWAIRDSETENSKHSILIGKLMPYVEDVDYDESILLWHVATELCYNEGLVSSNQQNTTATTAEILAGNKREHSSAEYMYFCKVISEYMLYLLVMQPTMMSAVAGIGQIRFRDTCAEAKKFFDRRGIISKDEGDACLNILDVNTDVKPIYVKGDRSKSVLFDASMLAKSLKELEDDKWKVMSKVWVELLAYAASHCRPNTHAQQVSKGGELLSFVWLLMAHLGLGEQFQINEGHARAKLIVGK